MGNQLTATDAENRTTSFSYDGLNRLIQTTGPLGGQAGLSYDPVGNLLSMTNANNQTVGYQYDALNRLIATTDPLDQITQFVYDRVGNQVELIDPKNRATHYRYDNLHRLVETEDAAGHTTTFTYDKVGNPLTATDAAGRTTTTVYDALNRPIEVTNPLSGTIQMSYDETGNLTQLIDPQAHIITYVYDALDRQIQVIDPLSGTTTTSYDAIGNVVQVTNPKSQTQNLEYDALNRLTRTTNPLGGVTRFEYDAVGNLLRQIDPLNKETRFTYDALNRVTQTIDNYVAGGPQNADTNVASQFTYDAIGNLTQTTNPKSHHTAFQYDALNRLVGVSDALSQTTRYEYDEIGNTVAVIDPLNHRTQFGYDTLDRLTAVTDPLGRVTGYSYDAVGNQTGVTDAAGVTTRYSYDALDRLVAVTENFVDGGPQNAVTNVTSQFSYDTVGNLTAVTDPNDHTQTFAYDALNRLTQQQDPLGHQTDYRYDALGNLTQLTDPKAQIITYQYDDLNRLTTVTRPDETVSFTYDAVGNRLSMTDPTGVTGYSYDALYRLTQVSHPAPGGQPSVVGYAYDAAGNRTGLTYPDGKQVAYGYDPTDRLISVSDWDGFLTTYSYDAASRLIEMTLPNDITGDYSYDAANQLSSINYQLPITGAQAAPVASYAYSYDAVGNRIQAVEWVLAPIVLPAGAYLEENGRVVLEAENGTRSNGDTHDWLLKTSLPGYTGTSYLQSSLDIDTLVQTAEITASPGVEYPVSFTTPGTYTVWLRGYPANAAGDSVYVELTNSLNPLDSQLAQLTGFAPGQWGWANARMCESANDECANGEAANVVVESTGLYTLSLLMREDGLRIDRILLTTDTTFLPVGFGPAESSRTSAETLLAMQGSRVAESLGSTLLAQSPLLPRPPASPFATNPALMLLLPLTVAGPLARRRRWRRYAWIIAIALFLVLLAFTSTAFASIESYQSSVVGSQYSDDTGYSSLVTRHSSLDSDQSLPALHNSQFTIGNSPFLTTTYSYDPLYRLAGAGDSSGHSYAYSYDPAGNRLTYTLNGTQVATYTYNAANWLTQVNDQTHSYDANGNLLSDGTFNYSYDSANRLTELSDGLSIGQYIYNGDGVRVAQIADGLRTDTVQDVALPLPQLLTAGQGGAMNRYLRGLGLIGEQQAGSGPLAGAPVWQYHLPDALGSVRQIADPQGQVVLAQHFDPFGTPTIVNRQSSIQNRYGFAGEEQDDHGHIFLRARTYNPETGRFLQSDPVMGDPAQPRSLHHYAYAFNNPVNFTDPSGLMPAGLYNRSAGGGSVAPPQSYRGQQVSGFNPFARRGSGSRSVNSGGVPLVRISVPNNHTRAQSQGFRPQPCGLTDILFGLGNSALNGNLLKDSFDLAMHSPPALRQWAAEHQALLQILAGAAIIGGATVLTGGAAIVPILVGAALGTDIAYGMQVWNNYQHGRSGRDAWFNNIDWGNLRWAAFHGAVAGAAAELIMPFLPSGGVDVTGMLESAFSNVLAGRVSQITLNAITGQSWDQDLFDAQSIAIDVLAGVAAGGFETWRAGRGASRVMEKSYAASGPSEGAIVPYDFYEASRNLNFPDRVTRAIEENLKHGRSIAIELKKLDDGSLVMKPAARYLDDVAPYKHIGLKKAKSNDFGILIDEATGELHISDPDIMVVIDDGRILSDAATVQLADEMNYVARGYRGVDEAVAKQRGPIRVEPTDPFQHSGRSTFFTKGDPIQKPELRDKIAHVPPKDGVAVFTLDSQGYPMLYTVGGGSDFVDWVRKMAYNENLSDYPWVNSNSDWNSWYNRPPRKRYEREIVSRSPIRPQDAVADWEEFLGPGPYTNIHPRTGLPDSDRLVSSDRTRSIRYGSHEMNHPRHHYHLEHWIYDPYEHVMDVINVVVNVQRR
ncbi:MAG: hypothetical protein FOGNACKC_06178 [Anaerolineae bacterium]|nr:hypothetical protein [Anaerolineae bacterium]